MNMFKKILVTSALGLALGGVTQFAQVHPVQAAGQTGYVNVKNVGWRWLENGHPYTGFRYYMGTYYWFINGVRQDSGWRHAWGMTYYTDANGRAVQGNHVINGVAYNFGNNGTFFLRGKTAGYTDAGQGWKWYENGLTYTGICNYIGAYYYFQNGIRQENKFVKAFGLVYYVGSDGRTIQGDHEFSNEYLHFGNNGTFYLRSAGIHSKPTTDVPQLNIGHFPTELQGKWYRYDAQSHQYSVLSVTSTQAVGWTEDVNGRRSSAQTIVQSTDKKYIGYFQHAVISTDAQKSATGHYFWSIVDQYEQAHDYFGHPNYVGATSGRTWWLSNIDSGGHLALNWYERQGYVSRFIRTRIPVDYSKGYIHEPVPELGL